jgi:N-carbamoyl-L-amino-acid hydrolase
MDLAAQGPQLRRPRGRPGQAHLLTSLRRANVTPPRDVTATGIRGEENCWFSAQHIGSRAALGRLPPKTLGYTGAGRHRAHLDPSHGGRRALQHGLPAARVPGGFYRAPHRARASTGGRLHSHTGIVSAIRGNSRCRDVKCISAYDHAGAVPRQLRRDAVMTAAKLITAMERL